MRLIIAGSRSFSDLPFLRDSMATVPLEITEVVSGGARGADRLGEIWAIENGIRVKLFPADWKRGRSAGYTRNLQMAAYADALAAFWDGTSPGTCHMILSMRTLRKPVFLFQFR